MKKLALTLALILTVGFSMSAQSLLRRGPEDGDPGPSRGLTTPSIMAYHNSDEDYNGNGEPAPLGSGVAVLLGLGAAYMVAKNRKED